MKKQELFTVSFLAILLNTNVCMLSAYSPLLQEPHIACEENFERAASLDLTWYNPAFVFHIDATMSHIFIKYALRKEVKVSLSDKDRAYLQPVGDSLCYSYYLQEGKEPIINGETDPYNYTDSRAISKSCLLSEQRNFEEAHPITYMCLNDLANIINDRNVVFYTGGGISKAAGVPTLHDLEQKLQLLGPKEEFIKNLIYSPEIYLDIIKDYGYACLNAKPTSAHLALANMAKMKKTSVISECVDNLHFKSGIISLNMNPYFHPEIHSYLTPNSLKAIDFVICVGLDLDSYGFLSLYKKHNPQGKIIAIDIGKPSYLGDEDFLIQKDAQIVLTAVESILFDK